MLLARKLVARFGPESVFLDCLSIRVGDDYRPALRGAVARSSMLLVLIGERWLIADPHGRRPLDDEQDWVRREIALFDAIGVRAIPVLIGNAELPSATDLPDDIEFPGPSAVPPGETAQRLGRPGPCRHQPRRDQTPPAGSRYSLVAF
jgi:hypothetical protein